MIHNLLHCVRLPVLALAMGTLALPAICTAQNAPERPRARQFAGPQGGQRLQQAMEQLNLTDEQKAKIKPITENLRQQIRDTMTNTTDPTQRREAMRQATRSAQQQIRDVLTPEQQAKLQELAREQRGPTSRPTADLRTRGQSSMIDRLEQMALDLKLTEEQQTKVRELSKEYRDEVATVLRDGGQADRQQLRTIMTEYRSRLTQLLTPEQTDQFNQKLGRLATEGNFPGQGPRNRQGANRAQPR